MRASLAVALAAVGVACATTYNMPVEERSRTFEAPRARVWEASLAALDDLEVALVQAEEEHGRILARTKGSFWDLKGYVVRIIVTDDGRGHVRVDANAETSSDDSVVDFGRAKGIVRDFLSALDAKMEEASGPASLRESRKSRRGPSQRILA